ncbi:MAG: DUF6152 family protein [Bryobacteraceae bacterium]
MKRKVFALLPAFIALFVGGSLLAHHSPSAIFDMKKPVAIKGTLTKVDWVNPHIVILLDSKGANGAENWKFESNPPSWFKHVDLSRADFAKYVGQEVTVGGVRAVDGSFYGYMTKFSAPDGTAIELDLSGAVGGEGKK